jgi:hypothetical protein
MTNSIVNIKNYFDRHKGLQRNNRYSLSFAGLPTTLPQLPEDDIQAFAVSMGARAIDSIADNLAGYGSGRAVPRSQRFVPGVMLTFAITNDNFITDFFNNWFNLIYSGGRIKESLDSPFQLSFYNDIIYNSQLKVKLLDPNGNVNRVYTFFEIYPLEAIPVELNMIETNKYMIYQVLLNYREFTFKDS